MHHLERFRDKKLVVPLLLEQVGGHSPYASLNREKLPIPSFVHHADKVTCTFAILPADLGPGTVQFAQVTRMHLISGVSLREEIFGELAISSRPLGGRGVSGGGS